MDLKIKDVAELLSVSETTIRRWLSDGKIPAYKLNHQYRFSRMEIENWMMRCKLKGQQPHPHFQEKQIYPPEEEHPARGGMHHFCLYRAIHQGDVLSNIIGGTKEEIIRNTTLAIASKLGVDPEVLCELLLDREALMPTALNNGIAVPHTRDFVESGPLDRVFVVFPEAPIPFGALDEKPVHTLFFLFAGNDKGHLQILAKLAHLSSDQKNLDLLQKKPTKKVLLEHIRQWESFTNH
ncbi:MAG: PTS sugar transporter subunit IIA [Verrucomicrobia bacterium]|nr:PTS sugar transporter subunit IIA [Verrucomicrobiota bacterium]